MKKEIYLEFYEGEFDLHEAIAWVIIWVFLFCGIIFKNIIVGLLGIFFFWYRHITIIVKERKK